MKETNADVTSGRAEDLSARIVCMKPLLVPLPSAHSSRAPITRNTRERGRSSSLIICCHSESAGRDPPASCLFLGDKGAGLGNALALTSCLTRLATRVSAICIEKQKKTQKKNTTTKTGLTRCCE